MTGDSDAQTKKSIRRFSLALLAPRLRGAWLWVETVGITLLAMALGRWASPEDPFFIEAQFPWVWIGPVLVAQRYGVLPGTGAAALLLAGWILQAPQGPSADIPKLYFLGGLLLVLLCGEFSGAWQTRLRRLEEINRYIEDRIERLTKRLYLLRLSHDRLEQDLLLRPTTLRDALDQLRLRVVGAGAGGPLGGAQIVLEFLAQQCQLEVAAIYATRSDAGPRYLRVAAVGEPVALREDDSLLAFALESRHLVHVQTGEVDRALPSEHLVVAPIIASDQRMLGVLVVTRMPFFALKEDTLQTLAVLLSAYADGVSAAGAVRPMLLAHPGCPVDFAEELVKLRRIHRDFGVPSHIVLFAFSPHPERQDMYEHVLRARRGPDVIWSIAEQNGASYIVCLMPLGGTAAVAGYLARVDAMLHENFGEEMSALRISHHTVSLAEPDPMAVIQRFMARDAAHA